MLMLNHPPVPLTTKEGEALMWGLAQIGDRVHRKTDDPTDPLFILLTHGWSRNRIAAACEGLMDVAVGDRLAGNWTLLEATILRLCVENSSWIDAYRSHEPTAGDNTLISEALATLRSLAEKLECFGIEVNHIPFE